MYNYDLVRLLLYLLVTISFFYTAILLIKTNQSKERVLYFLLDD